MDSIVHRCSSYAASASTFDVSYDVFDSRFLHLRPPLHRTMRRRHSSHIIPLFFVLFFQLYSLLFSYSLSFYLPLHASSCFFYHFYFFGEAACRLSFLFFILTYFGLWILGLSGKKMSR